MWRLLFVLFGLGSCFFLVFIVGLLKAASRADDGEERILEIISPMPSDDMADAVDKRPQRSSPAISVSEVSTSE